MISKVRRYFWLPLFLSLAIVAFLLNASRAGTKVEGCLEGCAAGAAGSDGPLRILSLNMLHGYPGFEHLGRRLALIEGELERLDPDLILLQEVPWTPEMGNAAQQLAASLRMNFAYLRANGNRRLIRFEEGEAILSRFPLREPRHTELRPRAGFFEHRVVLSATAETPWGDLQLFATHLTNGRAEVNNGQIESLRAFVRSVASGPAIVAGDFNAQDDSPGIRILSKDWMDLARGPDGEVSPTCCIDDLAVASQARLNRRIDYIFAVPTGNRTIASLETRPAFSKPFGQTEGWLWASDHTGLLATVSLKP